MPPFPKPRTRFDYEVDAELDALRVHKELREVPARRQDRLLLATWNVANFGVQDRRQKDHRLIAEILGWFDLVAVQEVADDLAGLYAVCELLPESYRLLISDTAGNDERAAFVYDADKVELLELVGRLSIPVKDMRHVRLPGVAHGCYAPTRSPTSTSSPLGGRPSRPPSPATSRWLTCCASLSLTKRRVTLQRGASPDRSLEHVSG